MRKVIFFLKNEKSAILSVLLMFVCIFAGVPNVLGAEATVVPAGDPSPAPGSAGLSTQLPGSATTVSNVAEATGGIGGDGLIQPDIDEQIFLIGTDENVLDSIMRKCKRKQKVSGWEVDHYLIDEQKSSVETIAEYTTKSQAQAIISVPTQDQRLFQEYGTVLAKGVNGYSEDGKTALRGTDLMLFIVGSDTSTGNPIVRAVNGPKTNTTDDACNIPTIPSGTELIILANACAETQKFVDPDTVVPIPQKVFLQKMILNQIASEYFAAINKRIPFAESTIAEAVIKQFRRKVNRTLWVGKKSKFKVKRPNGMGEQFVYTTEGIRWQIKREFELASKITLDDIINLSKIKFTGQNCSKEAWWILGRDLLADIQKIDFTLHKDITVQSSEAWGLSCTKLHTVFGDIFLKHEPTLDVLGYSDSGALLDMAGIVRYYMKSEETSTENVEGEEATRKCIITIDSLALKGFSHIWVNGGGIASDIPGASKIQPWDNASEVPSAPALNDVILLATACTGISGSKAGEIYQYNGTKWEKYSGVIYASEAA